MSNIFFGDFETTKPNDEGEVRVYLWSLVSGEYEQYGEDLESFMELLQDLEGIIFFHNLKFDFSYIHYYLIENNIPYTVLEKKGTYYSISFYGIQLRDTFNLMPMSLSEVGRNYNKQYFKTSIDYSVDFDHKATMEEIDYCINDTRVCEEGYHSFMNGMEDIVRRSGAVKSIKKVRKKVTSPSIAFEVFKELSNFEKLCPKTSNSEYDMLKGAYKGGYVYSNNQGIVENVKMIDCNSMYPFAYSTFPLPYGKGIKTTNINELKNWKFYIATIMIKYDLKEGYIPIIGGGIGRFGSGIYSSNSNNEYVELTVCNIDLERIKKYYDCDYELVYASCYNVKEEFFKKYCDIFIEIKNNSTGVMRNLAKVMLNSPYGKTAMNGLSEIKKYSIDKELKIIKSEITGYNIDSDMYQYLPIAIAITAYARSVLFNEAEKIGYDNIYYMDTDSIKYKNIDNIKLNLNDYELGAWKNEGEAILFKTIAPKKYVYYDGSKINYTCAGFNKKSLESQIFHNQKVSRDKAIELMNNFDSGLEILSLQSVVKKGGRAILEVNKKIT